MGKRKPPSRIRYEETHPVVSARLGMDDYKRLKEILETEGKSFAQFLREVVNMAKVKYSKAYKLGYSGGRGTGRYGTTAAYAARG